MLTTSPPSRGAKRSLSAVATVSATKKPHKAASTSTTISGQGALFHPSEWKFEDACEHLKSVDARFLPVIDKYGQLTFYSKKDSSFATKNCFYELTKIIVFQQLSGSIADKIFNRVLDAFGVVTADDTNEEKKRSLTPDQVLSAKIDIQMIQGKKKVVINGKESGLSESKSKYLLSLAQHFNDPNCLKGVALDTLDDETLEKKLVAVKGLGLWSVHMFMIFHLRRADVLATGDLGIRNGMTEFFGLPKKSLEGSNSNTQQRIQNLCAAWSPYSSLACCLMWKLADAVKGHGDKNSDYNNRKEAKLVLPIDT